MNKKKALVFSALIPLVMGFAQSAFAEEGKDYNLNYFGTIQGKPHYVWESHPERIITWYDNDGPIYSDYRLIQDANKVTLETMNAGSLVFNKNSCSYDIYPNGYVTGQPPKVKNISWTVKGKLATATNWSSVNGINNAACTVSVDEDGSNVRITGQKSSAAGTFQVVIDYKPGQRFKETMKAYNNNAAWNNHHIGFTETFEVPSVIKFGGQTYNLANHNGTTLNRAWIENNEAKLINLFDNYYYDFGIGFDNLEDVKITYQNGVAKLSLNYLYTDQIIPYQTWFEVDPTFGPSTGTNYLLSSPLAASASCPTGVYTKAAANGRAEKNQDTDALGGCTRAVTSFNVATIPDNSIVSLVNLTTTTSAAVNMGTESCDYKRVMDDPATAAAALLWAQLTSGTTYISSDTSCRTATTFTKTLGSTANSDLQSSLAAGNNTYNIGIKLTSEVRDGSGHSITFGTTQLTVVYTQVFTPFAVDDLVAVGLAANAIDLSWTAPSGNGTPISSYQINYTTPWGAPNTILVNAANNNTFAYTVGNLEDSTPYSFRIGVRNTGNQNMSGNIANATSGISAGNFTIGNIDLNATNVNITPIRFERTDNNATSTTLKVIYDEDYAMACDFEFEFAGTNKSYSSLSPSVYDADHEYTDFTFLNADREVIRATCWDQSSNATGRYMITQSQFPLIDQIQNFRAGVYGTSGMFGAFDLITLAVVILSMIGFNRVNETVGAILNVSLLGALAYFDIIELPTIIFGAIAVVMMVMIAQTRKE